MSKKIYDARWRALRRKASQPHEPLSAEEIAAGLSEDPDYMELMQLKHCDAWLSVQADPIVREQNPGKGREIGHTQKDLDPGKPGKPQPRYILKNKTAADEAEAVGATYATEADARQALDPDGSKHNLTIRCRQCDGQSTCRCRAPKTLVTVDQCQSCMASGGDDNSYTYPPVDQNSGGPGGGAGSNTRVPIDPDPTRQGELSATAANTWQESDFELELTDNVYGADFTVQYDLVASTPETWGPSGGEPAQGAYADLSSPQLTGLYVYDPVLQARTPLSAEANPEQWQAAQAELERLITDGGPRVEALSEQIVAAASSSQGGE